MGLKRSELVNIIKASFIEHTNKNGYVDMNDKIASLILADLDKCLNIEYTTEETDEQLNFDI